MTSLRHRSARPTPFEPRGSARRFMPLAVLLLMAAIVAAGCIDGDSERRFANEPIPTEDLAAMPTPPPTIVVPQPISNLASPVPVERLIASTGIATHRFAIVDDAVWSIHIGGEPVRIGSVDPGRLIAHASSPAGDSLALLQARSDEAPEVRVLGIDGVERQRVMLPGGITVATPSAGHAPGQYRLAWAADGQRLLVALATGGIVEVSLDGSSRILLRPDGAPSPRAVSWAPDGGAIAFVDGGPDGRSTALYVASVDALPLDPVVLIRPSLSGARQIADIAWVGGEPGILFSQRAAGDDLSLGGDLFAVSPSGGAPRLIAAAGATQVGVVGEFAVSADGSTVAYTVLGVVDGQPGFQSLWLHQIDGSSEHAVPAGTWQSAGALVWTTRGLTWQGRSAEATAVEWLRPDGTVSVLFATGGGTPVASPADPPLASPVATPVT